MQDQELIVKVIKSYQSNNSIIFRLSQSVIRREKEEVIYKRSPEWLLQLLGLHYLAPVPFSALTVTFPPPLWVSPGET